MRNRVSVGGPPATDLLVTHTTSRGPRGSEPDEHHHEDERNNKQAKATINDCDEKIGSKEETMGDGNTAETRRDGVCELRKGDSEYVDDRSAVDSARTMCVHAGWTVDPRERAPNCQCANRRTMRWIIISMKRSPGCWW